MATPDLKPSGQNITVRSSLEGNAGGVGELSWKVCSQMSHTGHVADHGLRSSDPLPPHLSPISFQWKQVHSHNRNYNKTVCRTGVERISDRNTKYTGAWAILQGDLD